MQRHPLPHRRTAVGAFIGEVDLRRAPLWCGVLEVHRQVLTAWADHEGWFGVVMVDIGWHVGSPTRQSAIVPDPKAGYASAAATIMISCEHRENDRTFPARVTNLHDLIQARS